MPNVTNSAVWELRQAHM